MIVTEPQFHSLYFLLCVSVVHAHTGHAAKLYIVYTWFNASARVLFW